ncbi:unnamed protein product [Calypogeia fissa]
MASESKKEAFRKYLEASGVLDSLTKVLVALYEEHDKPPIALEFIRKALGGPTLAEYEQLLKEKNDLVLKYYSLVIEHEECCRKLLELLPPPPEPPAEGGASAGGSGTSAPDPLPCPPPPAKPQSEPYVFKGYSFIECIQRLPHTPSPSELTGKAALLSGKRPKRSNITLEKELRNMDRMRRYVGS